MKLKTVRILIVSLFCCSLISASCVYGIGIGVNPAKMEFEMGAGENVWKNITVSNPEHTNNVNELPDCIKLVADDGDVRGGEVGFLYPQSKGVLEKVGK